MKNKISLKFLAIYLFEGALTLVLVSPLIFSNKTTESPVNVQYVSIALYFLGILGVSISDYQMKRFKIQNAGFKRVCNVGLWKYSRHPNYFFELLLWFSISLYATTVVNWYFAYIPFLVMVIFITQFTGIPHSEAQAIRSRGDLYLDYQRKTSCLVPWFPGRG